ncbi:MAG: hypothetical protein LBV51_05400 [Acholeplasmatales bacterium]|jgi:hypothetical protein|nr:hypothetical protein [Acholeplasmatales bacterium]
MARANSQNNTHLKKTKLNKYKVKTNKVHPLVFVLSGILVVIIIVAIVVFNIKPAAAKLASKYNGLETSAALDVKNNYKKASYSKVKKEIEKGNPVVVYVGGAFSDPTVDKGPILPSYYQNMELYSSQFGKCVYTVSPETNKPLASDKEPKLSSSIKNILFIEAKDLSDYKKILENFHNDYNIALTAAEKKHSWLFTFNDKALVGKLSEVNQSSSAFVRDLYRDLYLTIK